MLTGGLVFSTRKDAPRGGDVVGVYVEELAARHLPKRASFALRGRDMSKEKTTRARCE